MGQNLSSSRFSKHSAGRYPVMLALCLLSLLLAACTEEIPALPVNLLSPIREFPTLDDFWDGSAYFVMDVENTRLPMGESDTLILADGTWRSYVHASYSSSSVLDQCGAPVEFPGCLVIYTSIDQGQTFAPTLNSAGVPICQIPCTRCPCDSRRDHIDQQQYPRVALLPAAEGLPEQWIMTYEYRANTILRRSADGLAWSSPAELPLTGIWQHWLMPCRSEARIGSHPYAPSAYDCLVGSPPGIFIDAKNSSPPQLYLFVGLGQNPSSMGCYRGPVNGSPALLRACDHNPLFTGADAYGPLDDSSATANAYFDFRTISSADLVPVGNRYYLFYEGVRGPGPGDQGDTQFLLGLARSVGEAIDGPWELYVGNPILLDLPGNVGVGHADIVVAKNESGSSSEETFIYTSLDGVKRSRLRLVWK